MLIVIFNKQTRVVIDMSDKKTKVRVFRGFITPKIVEYIKSVEPRDDRVVFTVSSIRRAIDKDLIKMVDDGHVKEGSLNVEIASILSSLGVDTCGDAPREVGEMGRPKKLFLFSESTLSERGKKMFGIQTDPSA